MRKYVTAGICALLVLAISAPVFPFGKKPPPKTEPRKVPRGVYQIMLEFEGKTQTAQ
jgi:hypothetical protein